MTAANTNSSQERKTHYLKDYKAPAFTIKKVNLTFKLHKTETTVSSKLEFEKIDSAEADLELNGESLELLEIKMDNKALSPDKYSTTAGKLIIHNAPSKFILDTVVRINPAANKTLNGLYLSNGNYTTQCEPHGFRCITYYLDRPDILSYFTVRIIADKKEYPVLLSNGNLIESGDLSADLHWVEWHDPTLKPCYLFALVAGDFDCVSRPFKTMHGREVDLRIYVEKGKLDQADFALLSLEKSMQWDEAVYGREYDLDIYMIVAVSDFNFGAMENKGLNIFNDQYVLANPKLATDNDYTNIQGVIGHEYFHNWSGNRVTCRDWFQLSLKEGLTVFRDQSFTSDMTSAINKRIGDIYLMKNYQFAEDAGPMSHPIRPESYVSMNNFYTTTVYNKGAEVIRMLQVILGEDLFAKGVAEYFRINDGSAVTTDDFISAMESASGFNLSQFRRWYSQAGTPHIKVDTNYNKSSKQFKVLLEQHIPGAESPKILHIPLKFALLDELGNDIALPNTEGDIVGDVIHLTMKKQEFTFSDITEKPILSLLRNFSAPVKIDFPREPKEYAFIMSHDADLVCRWEAAAELIQKVIIDWYDSQERGQAYEVPDYIKSSFRDCLLDNNIPKEFVSHLFTMPSIKYLLLQYKHYDVVKLDEIIGSLQSWFAETYRDIWFNIYNNNSNKLSYKFENDQVATRSLKNLALIYLGYLGTDDSFELIESQYRNSDNMTDKIAALLALTKGNFESKDELFNEFYLSYKDYPLVIDKWFRLQAGDKAPGALTRIKALMQHQAFAAENPNRVRALLGVFAATNVKNFHAADAAAYAFYASEIMRIDKFNPQLATRLVEPLSAWRLYDKGRQEKICKELHLILENSERISNDLFEVVDKSLKS